MDITFFVGNGFDKALGLETGYSDFYKWLVNQNDVSIFIERMKKKIKHKTDVWADFEIGMGDFTRNFIDSEDVSDDYEAWKEKTDSLLIDYLNSLNTSETVNNIIKSDNIIRQIYFFLQGIIFTLKLKNYNLSRDENNVFNFHMISLNYTDSLDQIAQNISLQNPTLFNVDREVLHPHGFLSSEKRIILGVNDESQINNIHINQNIEYRNKMIKSALIEASYKDVKYKAVECIKKSDIICLYGVSLGKTDKDWWNEIALWLAEDTSRRLIIFWYEKRDEQNPKELLEFEKDAIMYGVREKITENSTFSDEERKEIDSRIIVYIHHNKYLIETNETMIFTLRDGVSLPMCFVEAGYLHIKQGEKNVIKQIKKDFYLGETQVTQKQYEAVLGEGINHSSHKGDNLPVEEITWHDAMKFCEKLNAMKLAPQGYIFSLPTEIQWVYAASGGKKGKGYKYSGSNNPDEVAWHVKNSGGETHEVGLKKPNELGLYDMSGNVWDFCLDDRTSESIENSKPEFHRNDDASTNNRVNRGGAYDCGTEHGLISTTSSFEPDHPRPSIGFRVALVPDSYDD